MTDPDLAERTYVEPLTPEFLDRVLAAEKPDAVLPTVGGQTALNLALEAGRRGIFEYHGVELLGAPLDVIEKAEDRDRFKAATDDKFFVSVEYADPKFDADRTPELIASTHPNHIEIIEDTES